VRDDEEGGDEIIYRADNFRVRFFVLERRTTREGYRPLGILVTSLPALVQRLNDAKIDFVRQRGLELGSDSLLLYDPAGNPVEIGEFRIVI
jgi:hypothetical protein